jgi:radical SAM protein with 4Fe4S-binding SPASM domain
VSEPRQGDVLTKLVARAQEQKVPLEVLFEVTHRCNLPCTHCYLPDHLDHGELTLDEIRTLFDQLRDAGTVFLTLTGGEVLSRRDFLVILDEAVARGFVVKVLTNATLVSDEIADHFARAGVLEVSVSVYGATAEVHDAVTEQPGSFVRTMAGIARLRERGLHVAIKTPVLIHNDRSARDVHTLALLSDMPCNFDLAISPKNNGDPGPLALQLAHARMVELLSTEPFAEILNPGDHDGAGPAPCNAGRGYCAIGPTGDVSPCIMMPVTLGNVRKNRFAELWSASPFLERLRAIGFEDLHACRSCDVKGACSRCPGLAMHRGQDVDGCDLTAKQVAKARVEARARLRVIQ